VTPARPRASLKWIALLVAVVALFVLARTLPLGEWLGAFTAWTGRLGWAGLVLFSLGYALATVLLLPGSVLTLGAGAALGITRGFLSVWVGATLGAALAFLVSRHGARRRVELWAAKKPRFAAVDRAVGREGWKIVLLTRLSPVFPFIFLNYAYGLTPVRFWPYFLASLLGMIPGTLMYVYLGSLGRLGLEAASGEGGFSAARLALNLIGLLATVLATVLITRSARRALAEAGI
jgi:uncharacterized membrane protein YdjX (TVP38/TMEM64 family)